MQLQLQIISLIAAFIFKLTCQLLLIGEKLNPAEIFLAAFIVNAYQSDKPTIFERLE